MPDRRRIFKHYLIVFESSIDRNLDEPAPSRLLCWHVLFDMIDFEIAVIGSVPSRVIARLTEPVSALSITVL